ncbi:MAG TPA: hypothetical protein VI278_08375 [Nitrososphaeraceae archaeon]
METTIFVIIAIMGAIGMLSMTMVEIPSIPQVHADKGGNPDANAGDNPFKHCLNNPDAGPKC